MITNIPWKLLGKILAIVAVIIAIPIVLVTWAQYSFEGKFYPNVSIDGELVGNRDQTEVESELKNKYAYYDTVTIEALYKDQPVATFSADQLEAEQNVKEAVDKAYLIGRSPHLPSRLWQQFTSITKLRKHNFDSSLNYKTDVVDEFLAHSETLYNKPPKNALFSFENGVVTAFQEHENGSRVKTEEFLADFETKMKNLSQQNGVIQISLEEEVSEPEVTLAEANNLGIEELIGEGNSDYKGSIPSRIHNVLHAASKFNGVIVPKGETFSFNNIIGDISAATGYQQAYIIQNGKTVLGDGGGVCQVSTTMFRAALNTGLPIVERNAHAYRVSYYENDSEPGFDATIFHPTVDFKFENDTPGAILIQAEIDEVNQLLTFKMYGTKDKRTVEISPVSQWGFVPAPEAHYEDDPTLPKDQIKQVDYAAAGSNASFDYKVKMGDEIVYENTFTSYYRPWRAVFLRGTKEG